MFRFLLAAILIGVVTITQAQKVIVRGNVTDSLGSSLPSATVMLMSPKDTTLVNFGVSDIRGNFEIRNVSRGEYLLKISFVGYGAFLKRFQTQENAAVTDLGILKLQPESALLEGVTVIGDKAPVTVKRDTIEFNAGSFRTKANANVEDLLKKLPGVEVETDGTITAQGEQVQRVTVDGREFFGRDPKLATRNLPADAVEKVQIFDKKSDQATFTGIDDGSKEKTVNLELKEEKRNAAFGNLMAGAGSDNRWQGKGNINRFSKGRQLSFLGMGNNINEQGFSVDDYMNFSGGAQQMRSGGGISINVGGGDQSSNQVPLNFGGRQNGILTNYAGGLNFNQDYDKGRSKAGGNYFYSRTEQNLIRDLERINYLPEDPANNLPARSYLFNQTSRQNSINENHRGNLTIDHFLDSANSIRFQASATFGTTGQQQNSLSKTYNVDGGLSNQSNRLTFSNGENRNLNANMLWRHKFEKKGRTLSSNLSYTGSSSTSDGGQYSTNDFFGLTTEQRVIDQRNTQKTANQTGAVTLSYTEPLGGRKYLEANYNFRMNRNEVVRDVFNRNTNPDQAEVRDNQLSNEYNSNYTFNRPSLNFRLNREKFNLTLGTGYQMTTLNGNLISRDTTIRRSFRNMMPVARFNYDFSSFRHLRLDYETSLREPSLQQLQPVIDNTDPLNISIGNPKLKPAYAHSANLNFTSFNPAKFMNFFAFISATYQTNAITTSQSVNERLVRTSVPVNVRDNLNVNANMNVGFPVKKIFSRFNIGPSTTYFRSINVLNEEESYVEQRTYGGNIRYNFTYKDVLTVDLSAVVRDQQTSYEAAPQQDQEYLNTTYSAETSLTILKNFQLNASFDYYKYQSKTTDFSQAIPIMNIWLSRFLLKGNSGELKVGVSNLLNRSLSVNQSATANYLQQETTNNLGRYIMVSFTYALNRQLNPFGGGGGGGRRGGGGGGMRMIIRQEQ